MLEGHDVCTVARGIDGVGRGRQTKPNHLEFKSLFNCNSIVVVIALVLRGPDCRSLAEMLMPLIYPNGTRKS